MSEPKFVFSSDLLLKMEEFRKVSRESFVNTDMDNFEEYKYEKGILEGVDRMIKFLENTFID